MGIVRYYQMTALPGQGPALRDTLVVLSIKVRQLPGSGGIDIYRDSSKEESYIFMEHWEAVADHEAAGQSLGKEAFAPIGLLLAEAPKGAYLEPVGTVDA
jgi:quinol monooxygenase YgiN